MDSGLNCDSWRHLGELLGYKEVKLDQFESSYQPSKTLLKDWLESSKGSELSVEMLLACLKELRRFDVIDVISESEGTGCTNANGYISFFSGGLKYAR